MSKTSMPKGTTVKECADYIENSMRNLQHKANRSHQAGKTLALTPINVGILAGRSLTAIRRLKTLLGCILALALCSCASTEFMPYSGTQQKWPTAPGAIVSTKLAVPVYHGLPPRPYTMLGELATSQGQRWAWSDVQSDAMETIAEEAKNRGADAIVVLSSDSAVTASVTTGSAYVVGNTAFANAITQRVHTGYVRVAAIKFL
jgi:hypothetical protein